MTENVLKIVLYDFCCFSPVQDPQITITDHQNQKQAEEILLDQILELEALIRWNNLVNNRILEIRSEFTLFKVMTNHKVSNHRMVAHKVREVRKTRDY